MPTPGSRTFYLKWSLSLAWCYCCAALHLSSAGAQPSGDGPTAQDDHRLMLERLGIKELRPGANGWDRDAANPPNYDEALANPYPCWPDPLLTKGRRRVDTPALWREVRRTEIVEDFDREVYGRVPADAPSVTWEVVEEQPGEEGGVAVVTQKLLGRVDNSAHPALQVEIEANLTLPADAQGAVPVVLQFTAGWWGGFGPPPPARPQRPGEQPRAFRPPPGPNWRELTLQRGWACARINTASIQEDNGAGLRRGIIGLCNHGRPREPDAWGALRAWAWGASRLLDHFAALPTVDARRVAVEGHSRWGKAALVAMAYDERFAAAYVSSSGAGGAKPHRRNFGEIVENLAGGGEYHWMAGNYIKYGGPFTWDDLPVDSHELIALCAPRPCFISSGNEGDAWVDARGMFLAAAAASPVYELLGKRGLGTTEFPPVETGLMDGELAYRQHNGGHTDGPNWPTFLDFAARYFEPQASSPSP